MSTYDTEQLDRLEPDYLANYGLTRSPFSNIHDDAFLYLDAERAQRLNLLQHMTQNSNLLLVVVGERGAGKTSLLTRFIKNAADDWEICDVTANTMMDAGLLLFQIAQGFGLQQLPHDSSDLQELLYAQIAKLHHQDEIPILVVDDAHELAKDALQAIFHLADTRVDNANLLRIILFAEPQIEKILDARDMRPLRERITHTMIIPPLAEDTTAEYLKHRMAVAGFNGGSPFTPRMVKRIYKASGGIPERINQLAHEILDKGDFGSEETEYISVSAQTRRRYKSPVIIAIAAVLIVVVLIFQQLTDRLSNDKSKQTGSASIPLVEKKQEVQPQSTSRAEPAPTPDQAPAAAESITADKSEVQEKIITLHPAPAASPAQSAETGTSAEETTRQSIPIDEPATTPPAADTQSRTAVAIQPALPQLRVQNVMPDPVPASNAQQTITINGEGFTPQSRVFVNRANKVQEIPATRVKAINDKRLQVLVTVGTRHEKWQLHVEDPEHGNSNFLAFEVAPAPGIKDRAQEQVLGQEPGSFTLQLFGSHDRKNAEAFISQNKLGKQANYFVSEHKGKDWYSVIYGVYPDQAAATVAIRTLPASLQKIKPWVRRFDDIQASINASRKLTQKQNISAVKSAPKFATALPRHGDEKQNESWIWSQDPSNFTLQLLGVRDTDSVKKFLREHRYLDGHAIYFHTRHDGRDWYAVVFGVYPDKQKAHEAIRRLPAALQKTSPWIRSFASIHAELARTE